MIKIQKWANSCSMSRQIVGTLTDSKQIIFNLNDINNIIFKPKIQIIFNHILHINSTNSEWWSEDELWHHDQTHKKRNNSQRTTIQSRLNRENLIVKIIAVCDLLFLK